VAAAAVGLADAAAVAEGVAAAVVDAAVTNPRFLMHSQRGDDLAPFSFCDFDIFGLRRTWRVTRLA
jgi:hypothetical protein